MKTLKIGLACDHAGYELKEFLKNFLKEKGFDIVDYGTNSCSSVDYPDFAHALAEGFSLPTPKIDKGVAICGSGNGVAMTLNKHEKIRAGLAWNKEIARLARAHNDANVLCIPARFVSSEEALSILDAFLDTDFEGGRHSNRIKKIPLNKNL